VYLKLRDRASYEFALASAAVVAKVEGGHIRYVRVAMGGVGTRPWRSHEAEAALLGKPRTRSIFARLQRLRWPAQNHSAITHSRSNWRSAAWCAR